MKDRGMMFEEGEESVPGWEKVKIIDLAVIVSVLRGMPPDRQELASRLKHFFGKVDEGELDVILKGMNNDDLLGTNDLGICPTKRALDLAMFLYPKITALVEAKTVFEAGDLQ